MFLLVRGIVIFYLFLMRPPKCGSLRPVEVAYSNVGPGRDTCCKTIEPFEISSTDGIKGVSQGHHLSISSICSTMVDSCARSTASELIVGQ
jgi:hypothetical protein